MSRARSLRRRGVRPPEALDVPAVVWSVDASPEAIAAAVAERDAAVPWGPLGPLGPLPVVLIPALKAPEDLQ